ncbi:hypothetical protein [uncultured Mycobacterium sp.]|uniref:hypothetical protein n=1 Tax=uncultured Mycobacterium sp. TaxID=171292 RepID=UPI0035CB720E
MARTATGIDVDQPSLSRARHRVAQFANAALEHTSFEHFDPGSARFGIITHRSAGRTTAAKFERNCGDRAPGASRCVDPPSPLLPISPSVAQLHQLTFVGARHRIAVSAAIAAGQQRR